MDTDKDEAENRRVAETAERKEEMPLRYETLRPFDLASPVRGGDIIKIFSQVESVGQLPAKSTRGPSTRTNADVFCTFAIMVNVR